MSTLSQCTKVPVGFYISIRAAETIPANVGNNDLPTLRSPRDANKLFHLRMVSQAIAGDTGDTENERNTDRHQ